MKIDYKTTITARVAVKTKKSLIKAARDADVSPSRLVARLVEQYLAEAQEPKQDEAR